MPQWLDVAQIYTTVRLIVEAAIAIMFLAADDVANGFSPLLTSMAGIYIALMGYALMSGWINMTMREAAVKLSKVILVLVLFEIFKNFGTNIYAAVWSIPEGIGGFIAERFSPLVGLGAASVLGIPIVTDFDVLMNTYSNMATTIAEEVSDVQSGPVGLMSWAIMMAPMFMMTVSILLAKVISAVLFLIAPIVFAMSLFGFSNNFLMSWAKGLLLTFLTVIIVFILGTVGLTMVMVEMLVLISTNGTGGFVAAALGSPAWSIPAMAPAAILAMFALILITQATSIASSIIGVAAINTQQAQGFMQIAALNAAR